MNTLEKSLQIALNAYAGKTDKADKTYILHPLRIMAKMATEEEMAVALLHDVIEDSDITAEELLNKGIPQTIVDAVVLLTKDSGENYEDFIKKLSSNKLASTVKKADIEDNINVLRLDKLESNDLERIKKYHKAWKMLDNKVK
jgi:(p)ppGpp synthase/HD superfamily hydrolase